MKMVRKSFEVQSGGLYPTFHNVTGQIKKIVADSGIKEGVCTLYSTTPPARS